MGLCICENLYAFLSNFVDIAEKINNRSFYYCGRCSRWNFTMNSDCSGCNINIWAWMHSMHLHALVCNFHDCWILIYEWYMMMYFVVIAWEKICRCADASVCMHFHEIPLLSRKKSISSHSSNVVDALAEIWSWLLTVEIAIPIFGPECILCTHLHL